MAAVLVLGVIALAHAAPVLGDAAVPHMPAAPHVAEADSARSPGTPDSNVRIPAGSDTLHLSLAGDSVHVMAGAPRAATADSARARRSPVTTVIPTFDQPRFVMLRSMLVPGWGQFHNHAYWKAAAIAGLEAYLIGRAIHDQSHLNTLQREADAAQANGDEAAYNEAATAYNDLSSAFVSRLWVLGAVIAYAMADAYVDAHFVDFDVQFKHDPALPQGSLPAAKVRLGLRWRW